MNTTIVKDPHIALSMMLRPMTIGDMLDRAVYFYRTHFLTLAAYTAIFMVPLSALATGGSIFSLGLSALNPDFVQEQPAIFGATTLLSFAVSSLASLLSYLLQPLLIAGIGVALHGFLLERRTVSLREMFATVRPHLSALLGTGVISMFVAVPVTFTLIIPPVGLAMLTLYGFVHQLFAFIVLYERRKGLEALRRGWLLVRGSIWRILALFTLYMLFSMLFGGILGGLLAWAAIALMTWSDSELILLVSQSLATILAAPLFVPLLYSAAGLLYFDLRMRHEGLDLSLAAAEAAGEPLDLAATPISDAPILNEATWKAVGILAAGYTALFLLLCGGIFTLSALFSSLSFF